MPTRASQAAAAIALVALLGSILVVLLRAEPRLAGTNSVHAVAVVGSFDRTRQLCQKGEVVPQDAASVELAVATGGAPGPALRAVVRAPGGRVLGRGHAPGGYRDGVVVVPIPRQARTTPGAEVCAGAAAPGTATVYGQLNVAGRLRADGRAVPGAMRIGYGRPGRESWLALAPTIAHRFSMAKTRIAVPAMFWVLLVLMAGTLAVAVRAVLRREVRRAAAVCAAVAVVNGFVWTLLVPPLQAFDEPVHVYYGQFLAETYNVPRPVEGSVLSGEELALVNAVRVLDVAGNTDAHPPWTQWEDRGLRRTLASGLPRVSQGADGGVGAYPPLYYGLGAIGYLLSPWHSLLDRLEMMRLVSVALAGVTALFTCLFVREIVPRPEWAWKTAGMVAAFQPLFGFLSGVFNPDIGMAAATTAVLYALARAWRRGLTLRLGALIGAAIAAAFLCKLAAAGLLPGTCLAVALLAWRQGRARPLLGFAAGAGAPVAVYMLLNLTIWDRPALLGGGAAAGGGVVHGKAPVPLNVTEMLTYVWESYLPRLPFMQDRFVYDFPLWDRYFRGWVGRFGWGDYQFAEWVSTATALVLGGLLIAVVVDLVRRRVRLWRRWPEIAGYVAMAGGLLALLGYTGYVWKRDTGTDFEQGRYLMPLIGFYALLVAAGLRGLGRRAGPVLAAVLLVAAAGHSIWAQLLTIARYYA